jgi:hypothetical protein
MMNREIPFGIVIVQYYIQEPEEACDDSHHRSSSTSAPSTKSSFGSDSGSLGTLYLPLPKRSNPLIRMRDRIIAKLLDWKQYTVQACPAKTRSRRDSQAENPGVRTKWWRWGSLPDDTLVVCLPSETQTTAVSWLQYPTSCRSNTLWWGWCGFEPSSLESRTKPPWHRTHFLVRWYPS